LLSLALYIKWATALGIPDSITTRVNNVINKEHDRNLGRLKPVYYIDVSPAPPPGVPERRKYTVSTVGELCGRLLEEFKDRDALISAVEAAILYHFMITLASLIRRRGELVLKNPGKLIDEVEDLLLENRLPSIELLCKAPNSYLKVKRFIKRYSREFLRDILDDLSRSRRLPEIGADLFVKVFSRWAKAKGIHVINLIESPTETYQYLIPPPAAARKIYSKLRKNEEVIFKSNSKTYQFKDLNDALNIMLRELGINIIDIS